MDNFIVWKYETIWIVNFEPCLLHFAPFTAYSCVRTRGPPPPPPPPSSSQRSAFFANRLRGIRFDKLTRETFRRLCRVRILPPNHGQQVRQPINSRPDTTLVVGEDDFRERRDFSIIISLYLQEEEKEKEREEKFISKRENLISRY